MRPSVVFLLVCGAVFAQQAGDRGKAPESAPKNLKVLAANTDIPFAMQNFCQALGVQCTYCHAQDDYASDANPKKETARKMIVLVRQIDPSFPTSAGVFPLGITKWIASPATGEAPSQRRKHLLSSSIGTNRWARRRRLLRPE